jgi:hypothetical protein
MLCGLYQVGNLRVVANFTSQRAKILLASRRMCFTRKSTNALVPVLQLYQTQTPLYADTMLIQDCSEYKRHFGGVLTTRGHGPILHCLLGLRLFLILQSLFAHLT